MEPIRINKRINTINKRHHICTPKPTSEKFSNIQWIMFTNGIKAVCEKHT